MDKLLYQGHGSYKITTDDDVVIYVDPYAGEGYEDLADIILVTHQHPDHNRIDLPKKNDETRVISNVDAIGKNGEYCSFDIKGVNIKAVEAYNKNHKKDECVGYVISTKDNVIYAAGDTSKTEDMENVLPNMNIDYALLPVDGIYNMGLEEAEECAKLIKAKHTIPIHMKPGDLFDESIAKSLNTSGKVIIRPGEEKEL